TEATFNSLFNSVSRMEKSLQKRPQVGPLVPPPPISSFEEVERYPETITDPVLTNSTIRVPPLVVQPSPVFGSFELPPAPSTSSVIPE
ncbi:hypothetical protein Tco_0915368, partial [Tanacetum coccineum]